MEAVYTFRSRLETLAGATFNANLAIANASLSTTVSNPRVVRVPPTPRDYFPQIEVSLPRGEVDAWPASTMSVMEANVYFHDTSSSRDELDNRMQAALEALCTTYRYVEYDGGTVLSLIAFDASPVVSVGETNLLQSVAVTVRCTAAEDA